MSIVTPTIGRATLEATAESIVPQLRKGDEWIVVGDGEQPYAATVCRNARKDCAGRIVYVEAKDSTSQYGNHQRTIGDRLAKGSHIYHIDDDDVMNPGAVEIIRDACDRDPYQPIIGKATWGPGHHWQGVLWREPSLITANVGTPMVVLPNRDLPRWTAFNHLGITSDFGWIVAAVGARRIVWLPRLLATVRPAPSPVPTLAVAA